VFLSPLRDIISFSCYVCIHIYTTLNVCMFCVELFLPSLLCVYVRVLRAVYLYARFHIMLYIYIYIYPLRMYIYIYIYIHIYIYTHTSIYDSQMLSIFNSRSMDNWGCMFTYIHTYTHTYMYIHTHIHTQSTPLPTYFVHTSRVTTPISIWSWREQLARNSRQNSLLTFSSTCFPSCRVVAPKRPPPAPKLPLRLMPSPRRNPARRTTKLKQQGTFCAKFAPI
jgi:hypothetical protein